MPKQSRRYTSDYPCLDLTAISNQGLFSIGRQGESTCKRGDNLMWAFSWAISQHAITAQYHISGSRNDGNIRHELKLHYQDAHFGNQRIYIECPQCHARRKQIYFLSGVAACRVCHQLHYKCQSESQNERKYRKLDRLLKQVNNFGYRFEGHFKRKGQHWQKFHQLDSQIKYLHQSIFADINQRFGLGEAQRHFGPYEID